MCVLKTDVANSDNNCSFLHRRASRALIEGTILVLEGLSRPKAVDFDLYPKDLSPVS